MNDHLRIGLCTLACVAATTFALIANAAGEKPAPREAAGIDLGHDSLALFVARDKETWNKVKSEMGERQMLPIGFAKGESLDRLDDVDFDKQMIVAVFWGKIAFSRMDEKCRIEKVVAGKDEVAIDCRRTLWGGAVDAAYRAWPYHAMAVPKSDLPVRFQQTTTLLAQPDQPARVETLATLKPTEWKWTPAAAKSGR